MSVAMEGGLLNEAQRPLGGDSILDAHSKTRSRVEDKQMYAASPGVHQADSGFVMSLGTRGASEPSECLESGYDGLRLHYPKLGLHVQLLWHAWSFPSTITWKKAKLPPGTVQLTEELWLRGWLGLLPHLTAVYGIESCEKENSSCLRRLCVPK